MGPLIHVTHAPCAEAEGLVCLMAGSACAPVRSQPLKEGIVLVDVSTYVERSHSASFVLELLEVWNEIDNCGKGG